MELQIPKLGEEVHAWEIQRIVDKFTNKCSHYFFMGREFKFDMNISQGHLAPPKKWV